ncbi:MAG: TonB-dependent receptor, partial [Myxococcota bacterium]
MGAYLNPQWRPTKKLILDGGARVQSAPSAVSDQPYTPQLLLSGALVYNFWPGWHVKLNYAQGARPPVFTNTNSNGEAIQIGGDPDLEVETSQALQAEVNARIFKGRRRIRELNFRADYSYTKLDNLIQIISGQYQNTADRGLHSAEFLGKLYIQGGHRLELSYTWLRMDLGGRGRHRSMPEHWFNLGGYFNLIDGTLAATTNLRVLGAMEDANRLIEHRDYVYDEAGQIINSTNGQEGQLTVEPHEMVLDRLPPGADLSAGLLYTGVSGLRLSAMVYNALNA